MSFSVLEEDETLLEVLRFLRGRFLFVLLETLLLLLLFPAVDTVTVEEYKLFPVTSWVMLLPADIMDLLPEQFPVPMVEPDETLIMSSPLDRLELDDNLRDF